VDRFVWSADTSTLTFDLNLIRLRSFRNDGSGGNPAQVRGNHHGGVSHFGPGGKLYAVIGDNGRRGWPQNLINGPTGLGLTDENNGPVGGGPSPGWPTPRGPRGARPPPPRRTTGCARTRSPLGRG
jgi:hypothetical protein